MTYLVMARKWRPNTFEEMVGQDHIAATIRNAILGDRIAHAYLFTGTRGVGKTTSARILAKCLNCETGPTPTPCGICKSCTSITQGNSMDVLEVDGASNNSVDNIRDLREQVKYAPMHGKYKVYIIDEVHMLTKQAFNALLKTLEEPPPHVVFIFATTEIGKVPHTIVSRVQRFDFKRISESQIEGRLRFVCGEENISAEKTALEILARKADGSMRDALSLFDQVFAYCGKTIGTQDVERILGIPPESLFHEMLEAVKSHDVSACLTALGKAYEQGIEFTELLLGFGEYLRDLFFARQAGMTAASLGTSEKRLEALAIAAGDLKDGDILRYAKIVSDLLQTLKSSPHPRLAVEMGMARMASLDRVVLLNRILQAAETRGTSEIKTNSKDETEADKKKNLGEVEPLNDTSRWEEPPFPPAPGELIEPSPASVNLSNSQTPSRHFPQPVSPDYAPNGQRKATAVMSETELDETEAADFPGEESELEPFATPAPLLKPEIPPPIASDEPPEIKSPVSLHDLARNWPGLVTEFMQLHPLVGAHLQWTTARFEPMENSESGETPELVIAFSQASAHMLAAEDAEFRKSLHRFLRGKLREPLAFSLSFPLEVSSQTLMPPALNDASPKRLTWEELARKEPIARLIHEIFEGRIIQEPH